MDGNRERTNRVRKFPDLGSADEALSDSREATQFGATDATPGEPLHVSPRSSCADDAAAGNQADGYRFRVVSA